MAEDKHFLDKHQDELIQRVNNTAAILDELLSENVIQQHNYDKIRALPTSQEIMRELFNQPLTSSGEQGKETFYKILNKHESYLIDDLKRTEYENPMKVETVMAKKMLYETLNDLRTGELDYFKSLIGLEKDYPPISRSQLKVANTQETVELMVETYREECVELTRKVLKKMNRADLVQKLSDTSSGSKEKQRPSLIQRVETMTSVIELLLVTLADLRGGELRVFQRFLHQIHPSNIQWRLLMTADMQDTVFFMVLIEGQQSVETTKKVLEKMEKTDLVQTLSDTSSGSKKKHSVDERLSALIHKVATMRTVKELLLETLSDLSNDEFEKFKVLLQFTFFQRSLELISWKELSLPDTSWSEVSPLHTSRIELGSPHTSWIELSPLRATSSEQSLQYTSGNKRRLPLTSSGGVSHPHTSWSEWSPLDAASGEVSHPHTSWSELSPLRATSSEQSLQYTSGNKRRLPLTSSGGVSHPHTSWSGLSPLRATSSEQSLQYTSGNKRRLPLTSSGGVSHPHTSWSGLSPLRATSSEQSLQYTSGNKRRLPLTSSGGVSHPHTSWSGLSPLRATSSEQSLQYTSGNKRRLPLTSSGGVSHPHTSWSEWSPLRATSSEQSLQYTSWSERIPPLSASFDMSSLCKPGREPSFLFASPRRQINMKDRLVDMMLKKCGQQSVEVTMEVLTDMNRTDLMQRLSETSSGHKAAGSSAEAFGVSTTQEEKHCVNEHWPALIQKVETMTSVIELLLETLAGLSDGELGILKSVLQTQTNLHRCFSDSTLIPLKIEDRQVTVFLMVLTYGQQSVEKTEEVLKEMTRTDLVQRLSRSSSQSKKKRLDEHRSALIQKVATMTVVKQLLLETLNSLSDKELEEFKKFLMWIICQRKLKAMSSLISLTKDRAEVVDLMLRTYSQQSVSLTREAVKKMNRTDLMQRLSKSSSTAEHEEKHSVDEHQTAVLEKAAVKQILLETLKDLSSKELEKIKWLLHFTQFQKGLPRTSWKQLYWADSTKELVDLMVQTCGQQSVEVTKEVFMDMNRTDLVKKLSVISSRMKEKHQSERLQKDSSDWTKLDPEVNCTDADEAPTYSLQSEAGNFECSVSGVRWVCKEKVSFKYQFCSLSGHMKKIESMQYMPAGSLMDITAIAGKLDVVYLPHWIAIDDNPTILDKFAVLHIDDCGDVVERVSEVTSSHVKLSEPVFSLKLILVKYLGLSVEIHCKVLIYKADTPSLKLHVYLIPPDRALIQELERTLSRDGYKRIHEPHPVKPLKMHEWFTLTADLDGTKIRPEALMLTYESTEPNFFQVLRTKNPDTNFALELKQKNELQPVWTCEIQKAAVSSAGPCDSATASAEQSSEPGPSYKKHQRATITAEVKKLLNTLYELRNEEFKAFKWHLQCITECQRENSDRVDVVTLMLQSYTQEESVKVAKDIFKEIQRNDLVQLLSDTSLGSESAGSSALASGVNTTEGGSGSAAEAEEGSRGCHQEQD